ncbi:MAG: metalloregulator ArsR/SmtB family transcription factor [Marinomonas sp.]
MIDPSLFFKALADDTRLRCLLLITQSTELCVCELMEALNETQPKVSRHLAQLRKSGLLSDRRQGQWVFYKLHPDLPEWAQKFYKQH